MFKNTTWMSTNFNNLSHDIIFTDCMLSAFQSDSTLYNCLNVKELYMWSLSDSNGIRTHNHLVL